MKGVILAAGLGRRLEPITPSRSKAMAPIAGTPLIGRVLERLAEAGIDDFLVVIHPDDRELRTYLETSNRRLVIAEQTERKGMGDAILAAEQAIDSESFLLTACDSLIPVEDVRRMTALFRERDAFGVVGLLPVSDPTTLVGSRSVVGMDGDRLTRIIEKPKAHELISNIMSLPIYVFRREILLGLASRELSERGEIELQPAIQSAIDAGKTVLGHVASERVQVTTVADLVDMTRHYFDVDRELRSLHPDAMIHPSARIVAPVVVEGGARIGPGATVGPEVVLESGAVVSEGEAIASTVVLRGSNGTVRCSW